MFREYGGYRPAPPEPRVEQATPIAINPQAIVPVDRGMVATPANTVSPNIQRDPSVWRRPQTQSLMPADVAKEALSRSPLDDQRRAIAQRMAQRPGLLGMAGKIMQRKFR